jgi:D-tyrosyl-tRNA(Tyr) deacylase
VRAVVQRVTRADVSVGGSTIAAIGPGLCVLLAVAHDDDAERARRMAEKLWHLRILADDAGVMNRSASEKGAPIMVVSQFTLYGDTARGRRPSWIAAARPEQAEPLVEAVVDELRALGASVATGRFGASMQLALVNDGPVTLIIDM